jgi:hypothetical protein
MLGSALVRDPKFQDRVVAETRALLSTRSFYDIGVSQDTGAGDAI